MPGERVLKPEIMAKQRVQNLTLIINVQLRFGVVINGLNNSTCMFSKPELYNVR